MEGVFPQNAYLRITIQASSLRAQLFYISLRKNEETLTRNETGYAKQTSSVTNDETVHPAKTTRTTTATTTRTTTTRTKPTTVIDSHKCRIKNVTQCNRNPTVLFTVLYSDNISMLKRSFSMEFDSDQYKSDSTQLTPSTPAKDPEDTVQITKKICNSSTNYEEGKSPGDTGPDPDNNNHRGTSHGRPEPFRRFSQTGENAHVTQSRSIFSHEDGFVYGNPKDDIKSLENPPPGVGEAHGTATPFENNSSSALDLSCKPPTKADDEKTPTEGNTYQNYQSFPRSNLEMKLVSPPSKKPSLPEQLQIAKIQQQQRRSMQQQQKLLQQMRRSLDPKTSNRQETCQSSHKNVKYYGNSTTNHEQNDLDNHARVKDEFHPPIPGAPFPQFPYPYFDPSHPKELPDNHPILPLLDPVYFSALYNAHGFLPPSSPSIAAAFIGTLQDALPKLPMMFPSTSSTNSPLLPQKGNENSN